MMLGLLWFDASQTGQGTMLHVAIYALSVGVLWLAIVPAWLMVGWKITKPLTMAVVGWSVLIPTGLAMMDLRPGHPVWLLGMMGLVWVADIAAYFAGRKFGKNKLAPSISPGKTWEGVAGAMLGVSVAGAGLDLVPLPNIRYVYCRALLIASWCWVGLAVIGDLFESAIKRQAGVKDSGALLPGHGGIAGSHRRVDLDLAARRAGDIFAASRLNRACNIRPEARTMRRITMRHITILGSTGSIGTSTLDVVARHPGQIQDRGVDREQPGRSAVQAMPAIQSALCGDAG